VIRDKAGGYGLQARGAALVTGVRGCSYNVIGFPLHSFCQVLLQHLDKLDIVDA
jgi:septum formation protein